MSMLSKGLRMAVSKPSLGRELTLDSAAGWLRGDEAEAVSADGAMAVAAANRAIELLCNSMAVLPTYITREADHKRMESHPLLPILCQRPNEAMSAYELYRLLMGDELTRGSGYAWTHRDSWTGRVIERIRLDPSCVTPMVMPDGKLWYWYADPLSGDLIRLSQPDVTHYRSWSTDGINGVSVIRRAAMTLGASLAAQRFERATWANGAQPAGVLQTDTDLGTGTIQVDGADGKKETISLKEHIRREWEKVHRGPDNAFRLAVLDHGLKYTPISLTPADAQFVESGEVRVLDLCRHFGVPPHLVYAGKQSYESNEAQGYEFVNYTLLSYETQWSQEDSYKLLLPGERAQGLKVARNLKVYLQGNTEAQANWVRTMADLGAYSVNEIRALDDRGAVAGGDIRRASLNYVPLEDFAELSRLRAAGGRETDE